MTYGLLGTVTATPGRREDLVVLLVRASDALRDVPDCLLYLVATTDQPDDVVVTEVWTDQRAHDASLTTPAVRALIAEARPLIAGMQPGTRLDVRAGIRG